MLQVISEYRDGQKIETSLTHILGVDTSYCLGSSVRAGSKGDSVLHMGPSASQLVLSSQHGSQDQKGGLRRQR